MCIQSVISINKRINALFFLNLYWACVHRSLRLELTAPYKKKWVLNGILWEEVFNFNCLSVTLDSCAEQLQLLQRF